MAKTRSEFYTYVLADFKRDDKETEVYQAYNDTIKHISNMKGMSGFKYQSWIPMVADQEDYPLPSNKCHIFHPIRYIESTNSSRGYPLRKIGKEEFSAMYHNPNASNTSELTKGEPQVYCIYSNSILVGPLPDVATYILELDWAKQATSQDAASDLNELGSDWEEVIKFGTLMRLYIGLGLDAEAAKFKGLYEDEALGYPRLIEKEEEQEETMDNVENNAL